MHSSASRRPIGSRLLSALAGLTLMAAVSGSMSCGTPEDANACPDENHRWVLLMSENCSLNYRCPEDFPVPSERYYSGCPCSCLSEAYEEWYLDWPE